MKTITNRFLFFMLICVLMLSFKTSGNAQTTLYGTQANNICKGSIQVSYSVNSVAPLLLVLENIRPLKRVM